MTLIEQKQERKQLSVAELVKTVGGFLLAAFAIAKATSVEGKNRPERGKREGRLRRQAANRSWGVYLNKQVSLMRMLIFLLCLGFASSVSAQVAEICDNQIDDDADGLIDCQDEDCSNPLFSDSGQALGGSYSRAVSLGDLDGDGDLDAWVGNEGVGNEGNYQANRVWINDGSGNFADSGQELGNSRSTGVALGDLDGDGDLDAWVANSVNQANRVWINDGLGNFTDSGQALGNSNSHGVALGDLDGDGDLDAWVANCCNQPNRVWINQGGDQGGTAGNFTDSSQALGNSQSYGVALGDLDGDGDLDAWVANYSQANRVWINDGLGNFADNSQALGNSASYDVVLGDLDGDGDLDAWVANGDGLNQANRVWINQGGYQGGTAGNFADSGQALGNSYSHRVVLGDLDGDGDLDAWVANTYAPLSNRVWINDGLGNFADSGQALGNSNSWDVSLGDLDGDGDLDAWVANSNNQANQVFMNLAPCFNDDDGDGIPNDCDVDQAEGDDCDGNGTLDSCDIAGGAPDCNGNGSLDSCDVANGAAFDCNGNGVPDICDLQSGTATDCNANGILDDCDVANGDDSDCDLDGVPDGCQLDAGAPDCNDNGTLDSCDIADGAADGDANGIPDECEATLFIRGECNNDGTIDIGDSIFLLTFLFNGGAIPACADASDVNDDGFADIGDPIYLLAYLFNAGPNPLAPFPTCGVDPTDDALECVSFGGCP